MGWRDILQTLRLRRRLRQELALHARLQRRQWGRRPASCLRDRRALYRACGAALPQVPWALLRLPGVAPVLLLALALGLL